ncbi:MAG: hypothetical protein QOI88_3119, partial [Gammaproteobacteria bacterium]|nr:hypothetical protein [Gammaproteobacteria bacterium]
GRVAEPPGSAENQYLFFHCCYVVVVWAARNA